MSSGINFKVHFNLSNPIVPSSNSKTSFTGLQTCATWSQRIANQSVGTQDLYSHDNMSSLDMQGYQTKPNDITRSGDAT
jgi:hypothetical protein